MTSDLESFARAERQFLRSELDWFKAGRSSCRPAATTLRHSRATSLALVLSMRTEPWAACCMPKGPGCLFTNCSHRVLLANVHKTRSHRCRSRSLRLWPEDRRCDCGNCRTLDGFQVATTLGTGELGYIARRLKCSRCGANELKMTMLPPPPSRN